MILFLQTKRCEGVLQEFWETSWPVMRSLSRQLANQEEKISPVMTCFQLAPREIPEKKTLHHSYCTVLGILMTIPVLRFICQVSSSEEELDNVQIQKSLVFSPVSAQNSLMLNLKSPHEINYLGLSKCWKK